MVCVYDSTGTKLISYTYDAWGNFTVSYHNGATSSSVAAKNPLRYRGYYYDTDMGLYYLQSRYYDSNTGRFVNADSSDVIAATPMGLTDKNLFAYCDNNPITRADDGGEFWNLIIGGAVGAVVGCVVAALNGEDVAGIVIAGLAGAASGVVAATGLGWVAQAGISAAISATADVANQTIDIVQKDGSFTDYSFSQTLDEAALGFVTSAAGSICGKMFDTAFTKNFSKSKGLYEKYLKKMSTSEIRRSSGRSTSALIRQANKFLKQSDFYLNAYRGVSSVVGSGVSLWNVWR